MRIAQLGMIMFSLQSFSLFADVISLRADPWCPHNCDPNTGKLGYMVDIAKAALEGAGHTVEYSTLNWARALVETREGKYNAIVGAAKSDAEDFVFPQTEQGQVNQCFYVLKDSAWKYDGEASLKKVLLGVITDYSYGDKIDQYISANKKDTKRISEVSGVAPLHVLVQQLQGKRIHTLMEDESVFLTELKKSNLKVEDFKNVGCEKVDQIFVAFGPKNEKNKKYAKIIAEETAKMRQNGKLQEILAKYDLKDWKKK